MEVETRRVVLLGKTGVGKSSLANIIFGETVFQEGDTPNSKTRECQAITRSINGRRITLIDTPGFFDTDRPEKELQPEIMRCVTECAPGPHAFLIVLRVEKCTPQEKDVIAKVNEYFSEEALKYAVIVFTHGDQLSQKTKIEAFVRQSEGLRDLVKKCGGRCHVIDNKYWTNNQQEEYRSNSFQVTELLKTMEKMLLENNGDCYRNEMLEAVEGEIQEEEGCIRQSSSNQSAEEIRDEAKGNVLKRMSIILAGITTGALLGAVFGLVGAAVIFMNISVKLPIQAAGGGVVTWKVLLACGAGLVITGAAVGGYTGYRAAEGAKSPTEAANRTTVAVSEIAEVIIKKVKSIPDKLHNSAKKSDR